METSCFYRRRINKMFQGEKMNHKLSNQAIGAIMMALQKSLLEQSDIVPVLQEFKVQVDDSGELVVMNPPVFEVQKTQKEDIETSVQ